MNSNDWKTFETLTRQIQAELAPDAEIQLGERLVGRSGVSHQCDVVVRARIGQLTFVCVFECKDHSESVGLDIVRSFAARIRDLGVHQGVIVSARGFTADAKRFAISEGILTYTLFDAETAKWSDQALVPVLIVRIEFHAAAIHLLDAVGLSEIPLTGDLDQTLLTEVRNTRTGQVVPLYALMQYKWDDILASGHIPRSTENYDTEPTEYVLNDSSTRRVIIRLVFEPRERFYFSHVPIALGRGFREESSGKIVSPGYQSRVLDVQEAMAQWPEVNPAMLAVKPQITFFAVECMAHESNSPQRFIFGWRQRGLSHRAT